jgi:undecaprenyl-diphosphatase
MQIWQYALLGVVQGLTEFLPISSKSHLLLVERLMGFHHSDVGGAAFEVALHVATLLSVVLVYRGEIVRILREGNWRFIGLVALCAAVSTALILPFKDRLEALDSPDNPNIVLYIGIGLLFTALWLVLADLRLRRKRERRPIGAVAAVLIGIAQAIAILPGVSRSGATIGAALQTGEERDHAARFSFLLSIPMILGAAILKLPDLKQALASGGLDPTGLTVGFVCSLLAGVAAIYLVLWMLRKAHLSYFAVYCVLLSVGCLIFHFRQ